MNTALGANPFTGLVAYDPTTALGEMQSQLDTQLTSALAINYLSIYHASLEYVKGTLDDHVFDEVTLLAAETAFNALIDDEYTKTDLPRYQRGMQDLNAVMGSAYTTGAALMAAKIVYKKAQFSSELRLQAYKDERQAIREETAKVLQFYVQVQDLIRSLLTTKIETRRYEMVALKEQLDQNMRIEESESKWNLEVFTIGGNVLASGHGGVSSATQRATPLQSALGGAMSGAAMGGMAAAGYGYLTAGAMSAGPIGWGIGIGALLGAALGLFS